VRPVDPADHEREEQVHDVVVERPATTGRVRPPRQHGPVNLHISALGERLGDVDDEEVGQQELRQRVLIPVARRPVGLAVKAVVKGQVGIQPGPVG
jgi:hypothetical protein